MLFAVISTDKPGSMELRVATREDHLRFLKGLGAQLVLGGPFTNEAGDAMNGSLIILDAPSLEAARALAAGDPYAQAGLFESVDIRPWKWTVNRPEG